MLKNQLVGRVLVDFRSLRSAASSDLLLHFARFLFGNSPELEEQQNQAQRKKAKQGL